MPHLLSLSLLLGPSLLACSGAAKKEAAVQSELAAQLPILPAKEAEVYARGHSTPADPVVALAAAGRPWDEALSGAAAAMALESGEGMSLAEAQWAAWRAGYAHPVVLGAVESTQQIVPPEPVRRLLNERLEPGQDLGLARARRGEIDRWVALVGQPIPGVPSFARQYDVGEQLQVGLPADSRWVVVSPEGLPQEGSGAVEVRLDELGEWWLDAWLQGGRLSVPIYAGMDMPAEPVVVLPGTPPTSPSGARDTLYAVLDTVRSEFELSPLTPDPLLETLAVEPLEELSAHEWVQAEQVQRLRSAGFVGSSADQVWCQASTVALCVEGLMRTAQGRVAFLEPAHQLVGAWALVTTDGTTLVVNLASEE